MSNDLTRKIVEEYVETSPMDACCLRGVMQLPGGVEHLEPPGLVFTCWFCKRQWTPHAKQLAQGADNGVIIWTPWLHR